MLYSGRVIIVYFGMFLSFLTGYHNTAQLSNLILSEYISDQYKFSFMWSTVKSILIPFDRVMTGSETDHNL